MTPAELTRLHFLILKERFPILKERDEDENNELRDLAMLAVTEIRELRSLLSAVGEAIRKASAT